MSGEEASFVVGQVAGSMSRPMDEMTEDLRTPSKDLLIPFWLRAVRVGLVVTVLTVVVLLVVAVLPGHDAFVSAPYFAVLATAALGGVAVALLPWQRLFDDGWGVRFLYGWSAADITLISVAVGVTGGSSSELFLLYALTTMFFGAAYPPRAQAGLLAFTSVAYVLTLASAGWDVSVGTLFLRLAVLGILAVLARFLAAELMREMGALTEARARAERWAAMLNAVGASARRMDLDQAGVIDAAVDAAQELGFEGVSLSALDEEGETFAVASARGLPEGFDTGTYPASVGMVGMVMETGRTVVVEDYARMDGAHAVLREAGFRAVVATPVWISGWLSAVLVGGMRRTGVPAQQVEALELLGAQLGMALENVRRFDQERRTVERLEELDRMKGDFLTTVSHELRNPLTVIKGVGHMLQHDASGLERTVRTELLAGLTRNAAVLEALVTNLLDLARLESRGSTARFDPVDLVALLGRCADRFHRQSPGRSLRLDVEPGLWVSADGTLIERAVDSLLSNVATHTGAGTDAALGAAGRGRRVEVWIRDHGPGMPPEDVAHLGERFFRGGDINTRSKGLGLGLALVRQIIDLHGGRLEVETAPGEGMTVSFRLSTVSPAVDAGRVGTT